MTQPDKPPATVRHRLKSATADRHDALDRGFAVLDLKNRSDYRRFLEAQAAVVAPLEDWLRLYGIAQILPDWPERRRFPALAADLADLNGGASPQAIRMRPPSTATLLGVTYVLEGSRLGARYLMRTVAASPDGTVRDNTRFLRHGHGQNLWPSFLSALEGRVCDEAAYEDAALGARQTFDLFLEAQRTFAAAPAVAIA